MRDSEIASCEMSAFTGDAASCRWCAGPLPLTKAGRPHGNRRWCNRACSDAFWEQHFWQMARAAALKRDGWTCGGCGRVGWADVPRSVLDIPLRPVRTDRYPTPDAWAEAFGLKRHDLPDSVNRLVRSEQRAGCGPILRNPSARHDLEVNHVVPRRGQGYRSGCHNHLGNLQTLCCPCHVAVTAEQRRARARGLDDVIESPSSGGVQSSLGLTYATGGDA